MSYKIGNNGNRLVDVLHDMGLLKDGQTADQIAEIARPHMLNERHLDNDDLWDDVFYRSR